jgi:type IV secretory pathway TraG/TraD family ATPase VirD4
MGRLILASLQSIAMQRANLTGKTLEQAPPIHLFIDECQHYITPSIETILTETRKYKLYLTLANQFLDQIDHRRTRRAIKGNTALKITGRQTEPDTLATISKITRTAPDEIQNLTVGQYHIKTGERDSVKMSGKINCLETVNSMTAEQWKTVKDRQIALYYCKGGAGQFGQLEETKAVNKTVTTVKKKKKRGLN